MEQQQQQQQQEETTAKPVLRPEFMEPAPSPIKSQSPKSWLPQQKIQKQKLKTE